MATGRPGLMADAPETPGGPIFFFDGRAAHMVGFARRYAAPT